MRSGCLECEGAGQRSLLQSHPLAMVPIADQIELRSENIATLDPPISLPVAAIQVTQWNSKARSGVRKIVDFDKWVTITDIMQSNWRSAA